MSKKNKAKFKKHLKTQILQDINREVNLPEAVETSEMVNKPEVAPAYQTSATAAAAANIHDSMIVNLPQIKHDLKKTAVIVLILAAIIGTLAFLDQKYGTLINLGDWLFQVLNIK